MARIRTIKPQFFKNEDIAELSAMTRLLFIGLWTQADRDGRLEDRPKRLKAEIFPYENFDIEKGLNELKSAGFIIRYKANVNASGRVLAPEQPVTELALIQIVTFSKHQRFTGKEAQEESLYPPPQGREVNGKHLGNTGKQLGTQEGNKEGNGNGGMEENSPLTIPASLMKGIEDLKTDCLKDQIYFVEHVARQCRIPTESIPNLLDAFNAYLRSIGETVKGATDYRKHAQNWIKKQDVSKYATTTTQTVDETMKRLGL
jgi:hypothetical protein